MKTLLTARAFCGRGSWTISTRSCWVLDPNLSLILALLGAGSGKMSRLVTVVAKAIRGARRLWGHKIL